MKSNWIAILALMTTALCGCRTVPQPCVTEKHQTISADFATRVGSPQDHEAEQHEIGQHEIEQNRHSVRQVGFQQEVSDDDGSLPLEPINQPAVVIAAERPVSNSTNSDQAFTLADLEDLALSNNPALAAANATVAKSRGLFRQVGVGPNPTLGYSGNQLADQATDQHTVFVEQEFVRGNKLALNRQVLRHTTEAQRWEIETQCFRVLTDVRVRFYEAMAVQLQLEATIKFAEVASRGVEVAAQLQEAGEGTVVDVLLSKTLLSETNLAKEQAEADYRGAWKDLAAIAGIPDLQPVQLAGNFDTPVNVQDWENTYAVIKSESPELAAANAIVCEKRAFLNRQQVQAVPNVAGQIGAGYDRATDSGLINLQVGVPIPTRNRNCGNISAAHADYRRAIENVRRIEMAIQSRLARAAQEFESANASVQKYRQEIIPQAKESLELSEKAYNAGELAFLQVLTVRRNYFDSSIRYIESLGKLAQAQAKIDGLLLDGGLDAPQDYTDGDGLRDQSFNGQ